MIWLASTAPEQRKKGAWSRLEVLLEGVHALTVSEARLNDAHSGE